MTTTDPQFIGRAHENIRELEEESSHLAATIRGLEERQRGLTLRIQGAKEAIRYYESLMSGNGRQPDIVYEQGDAFMVVEVKTAQAPQRRAAGGPTVAQMCAEFMTANTGEADVSDLASHLIEVGRYTSERRRQAYRLITAILLRDRRFRKVSPGRYGLADRPASATTTGAADQFVIVSRDPAGG